MADLQRLVQREIEAYREVQQELQKSIQASAQLMLQKNENDMVMEELNRLDDTSNVYKLVGPALIKQDLTEAKANVTKRLDYIKGEIGRVEGAIKSLQDKASARQQEVMKLQQRVAGAAGGSG